MRAEDGEGGRRTGLQAGPLLQGQASPPAGRPGLIPPRTERALEVCARARMARETVDEASSSPVSVVAVERVGFAVDSL